MRLGLRSFFLCLVLSVTGCAVLSCSEEQEHTAPAIHDRDSVPVMTTYGVNTLISDSGVIKYRIVTEEWEVNTNRRPSRWTFNKGILLTQFDLKKHVVGYIQCDTAVYFDQDRRWELHGRVRILTAQGLSFFSNWFRSDEEMTDYEIRQTKGWGIFSDKEMMPDAEAGITPIDTTHTDNMKGPVVMQR